MKQTLQTANCRLQTEIERKTGLEPATYSLEGYRSTKWATSANQLVDAIISWLANDDIYFTKNFFLSLASYHIVKLAN